MTSLDPYDETLRATLDTIDRCGWSVQAVSGDACSCCAAEGREPTPSSGPPFCYTVGLTPRRLPELLLIGLVAAGVLNQLATRLVIDGLPAARYTDALPGGYDVCVLPATEAVTVTDYVLMPQSLWPFSGISVLQVCWPDKHNRMTWEPGCTIPPGQQPLLSKHDPALLPCVAW